MDFSQRLDPELALTFAGFAAEELASVERLQAVRLLEAQDTAALRANRPRIDGVDFDDRIIDGVDGNRIAIRLYRPSAHREQLPALLWLHGGGLLLGNIESDYLLCSRIARDLDCVVLAVDYRLAPEHPYPAALNDAQAALRWLHAQADTLGINRACIALGGASAGGGLAACLALLNRDGDGLALTLQLLIYPMLDDRNITPSSHAISDRRVWDRSKNLFGWRSYLATSAVHTDGSDQVSAYAAAARAQDLADLPPTYLAVGALDLFVDEDVDYAARLLQAGVATELHVYPGAFHSFDGAVPDAAISRRFTDDYLQALRRALHPA